MTVWFAYTAACVQPAGRQSLPSIFLTGLLSAALNLKPGLFVLAFIPQFVDPARGSVSLQMVVYGVWFALLTAVGFALMGILPPFFRATCSSGHGG